jgi:L,D-transpeptidase ErfK/SrfK
MKLISKIQEQFHTSKTFRALSYLFGTLSFVVIIGAFVIVLIFVILPAAYDEGAKLVAANVIAEGNLSSGDSASTDSFKKQAKVVSNLEKQFDKLTPNNNYMVINTTENKFFLYTGKDLKRAGICSTGSYTQLVQGDKKKWEFKTPKGIFKIRERRTEPVWKKPDWAFVEEGLPIPSPNHPSRFEYGTLGDYALSLGDGYMIHGTLYQRFLGLAVTHGCIRLGDDDLEAVFKAMPTGAKVYIY